MSTTQGDAPQTWRLIYISRNEIRGSETEVQAEIEQILSAARASNDAVGVCGALLFNRDCFAQALEGPQAQVQATFERIQCDPRHSDVVILGFEAVEAPVFRAWSMAYVGGDRSLDEGFDSLGVGSGRERGDVPAHGLFALMLTHLDESETRGNCRRAA